MTYNKDTEIGDVTTSEYYEGTPEEIAEPMNRMPRELKIPHEVKMASDRVSVNDVAKELAKQMERKIRTEGAAI